MEQPIQTANYLREVERLNIKIYDLDAKDQLLWYEVEELLKDNGLWDDWNEFEYDNNDISSYPYAKRIYAVTTKMIDFDYIKNGNQKWTPEIKSVIYSPEESLYRYMYEPEYCDKWYLELPFEGDESKTYNYIIILLDNDNVILGRYGNAFWGLSCYYNNETKQVPFNKLDEPYKSLIIEKLLEEKKQGYNMENLIHLMPKNEEIDIKDDTEECESDITEEDIKKYKKN